MIGHKSIGSHSIGHKALAHGGVGHKIQPHSKSIGVMKVEKEPEIHNTFNSSKTQQQPIKNYIRKF